MQKFIGYGWIFCALVAAVPATAQPTADRQRTGFVEATGYASSTGLNPFWIQSNQWGVVPAKSSTGLIRAGYAIGYRSDSVENRRKLDWGGGVELDGQVGAANQFIVGEAYLKARWRAFEVWGGRRRQLVGLADSPLSSGSFNTSPNALPIPSIQAGIPNYVPLGFTKDFVAIKGFISHGWFGSTDYVQHYRLHQKALYVRLGKPNSFAKVYGNFNHEVQWAGFAPIFITNGNYSRNGNYGKNLDAYLHVILPWKDLPFADSSHFTSFDYLRVGNHLGSVDVALELGREEDTWSVKFYKQFFYDIGRNLANLKNLEDGLHGIRLINHDDKPLLKELIVEYLNTYNQGRKQFGKLTGFGEADNYYNNGQYLDGWTYKERTIGTPFIPHVSQENPNLPAIQFRVLMPDLSYRTVQYMINNNQVVAWYIGATGWLGENTRYTLKGSYSQNYGIYTTRFPPNINQLSMMAAVEQDLNLMGGATLKVGIGYDNGKLLPNQTNIGGYVGLRKHW